MSELEEVCEMGLEIVACIFLKMRRISLVVQWLRIGLPMLGTVSVPDVGRSHMMRGKARAPTATEGHAPWSLCSAIGAQPSLLQLENGCMQQ